MPMKIFGRTVSWSIKNQLGNATFDQLERLFSGYGTTKSGASVNYETALQIAAVYGCVRVRAEDIGKLPFKLYQADKDDLRRSAPARQHPLYKILSRKPNSWMTSQQFREALTASSDLMGGGYAIKWWKNTEKTEIAELIPVLPGMVEIKQREDYSVFYRITMANGGKKDFAAEDIFHLPGLCLIGHESGFLTGTNVLKKAAEAFGLALTSQQYIASLMKNGATPPGILTTDVPLTADQVTALRKLWQDQFAGAVNAGQTPVLYNGMKYAAMAMNNRDAQQIENDDRATLKICAYFRVHPNKIFAFTGTASSTYASASQFAVDHVGDCIKPTAERWTNAVDNQLLTDQEVDEEYYFSKIPLLGLLDGDPVTRWQVYKSARETTSISVNEIREKEDMDILEDEKFDDPTLPLNTNPLPANSSQKPAEPNNAA